MRAGALETGVVSQKAAAPIAVWGLRVIAFGLLSVSMFGNFITFNGGWGRWNVFDEQATGAFFGALAWQAIWTVFQFAFLRTKFWPGYLFALAASAIPSIMGYYVPLLPWLEGVNRPLLDRLPLGQLRGTLASIGAWILLGLGVLGSDWLPERILVKK